MHDHQVLTAEPAVELGSGDYTYRVLPNWAKLPDGMTMLNVAGVAVDRFDNVYAFARNATAPINVFDRNGTYLRSWGTGDFSIPHALAVGPDDTLYCADTGNHTIRKFTLEGKLLLQLGIPDQPAPMYSGDPFNKCTHTALSPDNEVLYVSDGYGNGRVHMYSQRGKLLRSWGNVGINHGEFNTPHNICCDGDGWVYVADRENHRVQIFNGAGAYETHWDQLHRPCGLAVDSPRDGLAYVTELRPSLRTNSTAPNLGPRVSVVSKTGAILARLDNEHNASPAHKFVTPHCIAVDSQGDIYVADTRNAGMWAEMFPDGEGSPGSGTLKKLVRSR